MGVKVDITGQRFGRIFVIKESEDRDKNKRVLWDCICDCGNRVKKDSNVLRSGHVVSCGCYQSEVVSRIAKMHKKDLTGMTYGRLTVAKDTGKREKGRSIIWLCECECGNFIEVSGRGLTTGNNRSCGCLFTDYIVKRNVEWGINHRGDKHPGWNPELTEKDRAANRTRQKDKPVIDWRINVFKRDKHTCQICHHKGNKIVAHHLDGWNWCKDKRFEVENGVTLCKVCHINFHKKYGYGNNTKEQYEDFFRGAGIGG